MGGKRFLLAVVLVLALAAPAGARTAVLTTVGEGGPTTCIVSVVKDEPWPFGQGNGIERAKASTSCDRPIEQSGQVRLDTDWYGPLCSGLRATCESRLWVENYDLSTGRDGYYDITLRAPFGQGWVYTHDAADDCSGQGTDRLTCTFASTYVVGPVST